MTNARDMNCYRADGSLIEVRKVSSMARFSMQAASDHRAADKAKRELSELDHVTLNGGHTVLHFNAAGQSEWRG